MNLCTYEELINIHLVFKQIIINNESMMSRSHNIIFKFDTWNESTCMCVYFFPRSSFLLFDVQQHRQQPASHPRPRSLTGHEAAVLKV